MKLIHFEYLQHTLNLKLFNVTLMGIRKACTLEFRLECNMKTLLTCKTCGTGVIC